MNIRWNCNLLAAAIAASAATSALPQSQAIDCNIDGYVRAQDGAALNHAHVRIAT
ncbi:hypothetical protein [Bryocella elongata]|uniref:hypothetical protein n=1 Tax=Bryocella elongata TaxID=863522 RepID=UPI0013575B3C|nr:hypothetical protein [Bryocella elongata]